MVHNNSLISPDDVFDSLTDRDKTTKIVGYVNELHSTKKVGKNLEHLIFEFVLTNGTRKVSCVVWNDVIGKHEDDVKMNRIVHITCGMAKKTYRRDETFVPFEITIMESTVLNYLGFHAVTDNDVPPPITSTAVDFESILNHENELISIDGYLKQTFRVIQSRFQNMSLGSAAITNGSVKINVQIANYSALAYEVGSKITVTGVFNQKDGLATIKCKDVNGIILQDEVPRMDLAELLRGNKFPKRKAPE